MQEILINWGDKTIEVEKKILDSSTSFTHGYYVSKIYWDGDIEGNNFTDKGYTLENGVRDIVDDAVQTIRDS